MRNVLGLVLERPPRCESLALERALGDGGLDRAIGLAVVPAIGEPAPVSECGEVSERVR